MFYFCFLKEFQSNAENLALKGDIADIEKEDTLV